MAKSYKPTLIGKYEFDEVTSALQKMIRRGNEYESCYWAYILHQSGYGLYLWRRLIVICAEDIGNGDSQAALVINSCHLSWEHLHKHNKEPELSKFFPVVSAVLYLCRCPKVRENDSLLNLIHERFESNERLEIPEIAKDFHTRIGRQKLGKLGDFEDGRELERWQYWFSELTRINKPAYQDKWEQDFKNLVFKKIEKK